MKKIVFLVLIVLFITACSSFMVDRVEVHNALIQKMNTVLHAEKNYYDLYYELDDGEDVKPLVQAHTEFKREAQALDDYFENTSFNRKQKVFVDEYNDYYKDFLKSYVKASGDFVKKVEKEGFNVEKMKTSFKKLDEYGAGFVKNHNKLIDTINLQADQAVSGESSNN